jgi:serine/threonine protein phosphatase PrpC
MDLYSGAIDYMVYKLESKYIIILLDNHNPLTYCSGSNFDPKSNIDIEWPQICFFGVFDGHGGSACADYLRDNLHNFVV